ncbi:MAG: site-2 protease family protein [Bradymonadaceae bacterium]
MFFERSGYHFFTWQDIKVSVSMWYLILMAFIIFFPMFMGGSMLNGVLFAIAVTMALVVHEFGHALVAKYYKLSPSILLHGFGGLCISDEAHTDGDDAKILLAGPGAGLVFGVGLLGLTMVAPGLVGASPVIATLVGALIWVNIVWSLFNLLLPIWPLDGGQLFHLIMRRFTDPARAQRIALNVSVFTVIPVGIAAFMMFRSFFIAIIAVFIIMDNINALQTNRSLVSRASAKIINTASSFHEELLADARAAWEDEDWREAYRLGHHMRSVGAMPPGMRDEVWTLLGLSSIEMGNFEEALGYLNRAPKNSRTKKAIERCKVELGTSDASPAAS